MKYLLLASLLFAPVQDTEEAITMSPSERAFVREFIMHQSERIDNLEKALRAEKIRTGCA